MIDIEQRLALPSLGLGLGLGLGGSAALRWSPAQMGSSLIRWTDASRSDLITGSPVISIASPVPTFGALSAANASERPAISSGRLTFDGVANSLLDASQYSYTDAVTLPDAASTEAGKGFTCTGLARDADGTWWVGNHGKKNESTAGSESFDAGVVHVSADRQTKLSEIKLSALGVTQGSVQGVCIDTSDDTIWFCVVDTGKIHHVSKAGALLGTLTPGVSVNGIAYDSINDLLIITGNPLKWISKTDASVVKSIPVLNDLADHLFFAPTGRGAQGSVYITMDVVTQYSIVIKYDVEGKMPVRVWQLSQPRSIEGIVVVGDTMYLANDAYYHNTPANYLNQIMAFGVNATVADTGSKLCIAGVFKSAATPAATKAIVAGGDPSFAIGVGLFFPSTANRLRLVIKTGASSSQVDWTLASTTTEFIAVVEIDTAAQTAALYVNGALVSSQAISNASGSIPGLAWILGADIGNGARERWFAGTVEGLIIVADFNNRTKIEGFLAWQSGNQGLLPGGHPYQAARP